MGTWSKHELRKIAEADDLHISPFREDGKTYGTPTWIWSVAVDDALYVRGYNGQKSSWYQAAVRQKSNSALLKCATTVRRSDKDFDLDSYKENAVVRSGNSDMFQSACLQSQQ